MPKSLKKQKTPAQKNLPKVMNDFPEAEPVTAAGGIVFRDEGNNEDPMILMIFRNGYWDLPKGKLEPGETIEMCAVREVAEEVGSELPSIVRKVGTSYHEYPEKRKVMGKTTHWYSMIYSEPQNFTPQGDEGIEQVRWVPLSEAVDKAGFENLKEILRTFSKQ